MGATVFSVIPEIKKQNAKPVATKNLNGEGQRRRTIITAIETIMAANVNGRKRKQEKDDNAVINNKPGSFISKKYPPP